MKTYAKSVKMVKRLEIISFYAIASCGTSNVDLGFESNVIS